MASRAKRIALSTKTRLFPSHNCVIGTAIFADWHTAGGTATIGQATANKAVAAALAPVCVKMFKRDTNFPANLVELKKADEWARATYIEKGGWGKMPDAAKLDSETARSCAALLVKA